MGWTRGPDRILVYPATGERFETDLWNRFQLPTWWLMVHRWFKTRLEQEGSRLSVEMAPLSALPPDTDLIVVPPELVRQARGRAPQVECASVTSNDYPRQVVELLARLRSEGRYTTSAPEDEGAPTIVRYVGYERAD